MKYSFNPGDNFVFETTESSPDKYLQFAFDYSGRIAESRPEIVPQIMYEVVRFYDRVESEYDRNMLLRLLPPWISQFGTVTNRISDATSCREMTYAFIVKLYELTQKAGQSPHQSSKQLTLSYALWGKLALCTPDPRHFGRGRPLVNGDRSKRCNEMLISEIVKYMISKYTVQGPHDEQLICEKVLERICKECQRAIDRDAAQSDIARTNLKLVAKCLGMSLHRYPDQFPLDPEEFQKYKMKQIDKGKRGRKGRGYTKDDIKSKEKAAFTLIHKLLDSQVIDPFRK